MRLEDFWYDQIRKAAYASPLEAWRAGIAELIEATRELTLMMELHRDG